MNVSKLLLRGHLKDAIALWITTFDDCVGQFTSYTVHKRLHAIRGSLGTRARRLFPEILEIALAHSLTSQSAGLSAPYKSFLLQNALGSLHRPTGLVDCARHLDTVMVLLRLRASPNILGFDQSQPQILRECLPHHPERPAMILLGGGGHPHGSLNTIRDCKGIILSSLIGFLLQTWIFQSGRLLPRVSRSSLLRGPTKHRLGVFAHVILLERL